MPSCRRPPAWRWRWATSSSGAVLVEVIFGYPGIGALLFQAIEENDFFLIQGIVFTVIVALGFATFLLDICYPWLDPRISYHRT